MTPHALDENFNTIDAQYLVDNLVEKNGSLYRACKAIVVDRARIAELEQQFTALTHRAERAEASATAYREQLQALMDGASGSMLLMRDYEDAEELLAAPDAGSSLLAELEAARKLIDQLDEVGALDDRTAKAFELKAAYDDARAKRGG